MKLPSLVAILLTLARLSRTQAPVFTYMLEEEYKIDPNSVPRIQLCYFTGQPTPNVTWTFDGSSVPTTQASGGVYSVPGDGTLVLERASSSRDSGMYTCTGTNSLGSQSGSTQIIISRAITNSARWYIHWYMWFLYSIVVWAISLFFFIGWFFYQKKRANEDLPPPDGWIGN